jgi:hypothetical protein
MRLMIMVPATTTAGTPERHHPSRSNVAAATTMTIVCGHRRYVASTHGH